MLLSVLIARRFRSSGTIGIINMGKKMGLACVVSWGIHGAEEDFRAIARLRHKPLVRWIPPGRKEPLCNRGSNNPSLKRPDNLVAPE